MQTQVIFQRIKGSHLVAVQDLLSIAGVEKVLISVAFANVNGLDALEKSLRPVALQTKLFIGIRNGITSAQALEKGLQFGCSVYVVDTGTPSIVFHPKVYLSRNLHEVCMIVGSANMTGGGLRSNIEASLMVRGQITAADELEQIIEDLPTQYPGNVWAIQNSQSIRDLLDEGLVVDENIVPTPRPVGGSSNAPTRNTPVMPLATPAGTGKTKRASRLQNSLNPPVPQSVSGYELVWTSKPLSERSLSIPTNQNTNPTGSMLFAKGTVVGIDQRHYFRDVVFSNVQWSLDAQKPHIERAVVAFGLVIRGVDYGVFDLHLSHNTLTTTPAYQQRNSMTHLHWGTARPLVARQDLLESTLCLYREKIHGQRFIIEID